MIKNLKNMPMSEGVPQEASGHAKNFTPAREFSASELPNSTSLKEELEEYAAANNVPIIKPLRDLLSGYDLNNERVAMDVQTFVSRSFTNSQPVGACVMIIKAMDWKPKEGVNRRRAQKFLRGVFNLQYISDQFGITQVEDLMGWPRGFLLAEIVEIDENDTAVEKKEIQPLKIIFDSRSLDYDDKQWRPSMERFAGEVADEIERRLAKLNKGEEVLIAEVFGLPGLSEIHNTFSSNGVGAKRLAAAAPEAVVKFLESKGISSEILHNEGDVPMRPNTVIALRQSHERDTDSYKQDMKGSTFSYQNSKLRYLVHVVEPVEQEVASGRSRIRGVLSRLLPARWKNQPRSNIVD